MKVFLTVVSVLLSLGWSAPFPAWAGNEKSGGNPPGLEMEQQRQSATEELMGMLKETMGMLRNLDGKPSADDKKRLDAMMARLNVLLAQQKEMMRRLVEEQKQFMQRQNETFSPPPRQEEIIPRN